MMTNWFMEGFQWFAEFMCNKGEPTSNTYFIGSGLLHFFAVPVTFALYIAKYTVFMNCDQLALSEPNMSASSQKCVPWTPV